MNNNFLNPFSVFRKHVVLLILTVVINFLPLYSQIMYLPSDERGDFDKTFNKYTMRHFIYSVLIIILSLNASAQKNVSINNQIKIDRKAVIERHKIITTSTNPKSPAQVGNGEFAFGVDITGLQSFVPFNTLSHWCWHSFPVPDGLHHEDFKGVTLDTHGRGIRYEIHNKEQPELSSWLPEMASLKQQLICYCKTLLVFNLTSTVWQLVDLSPIFHQTEVY